MNLWPHFCTWALRQLSSRRLPSTTFSTNRSETSDREFDSKISRMGMLNAKNRVPEHQQFYQQAYKAHTRLWRINSRSRWYMTPYTIVLWGTFGATFWAVGRKITGHNTWFSKD